MPGPGPADLSAARRTADLDAVAGAAAVLARLDRRVRIGLVPGDREHAVPLAEQVLAEEGEVQPHGTP
ncbi:hypothetical protein [Geodermatophilus obscurus]|uniref:hypothetical protein n=1 Tax=Geodermatophilus obscurus TaxID=1861 RepID=UPI001140B51A|nr:hypothetical protein [Geodermatophilus obscurus]